jgi:hypothetical protein
MTSSGSEGLLSKVQPLFTSPFTVPASEWCCNLNLRNVQEELGFSCLAGRASRGREEPDFRHATSPYYEYHIRSRRLVVGRHACWFFDLRWT